MPPAPVFRTRCIAHLAKTAQLRYVSHGKERDRLGDLEGKVKLYIHVWYILTTSWSSGWQVVLTAKFGCCNNSLLVRSIMSSLAGALEEPVRYNHSYPSALSSRTHEQDVDMETSGNEPEVKEEPNSFLGRAMTHRDGGDEVMDDLFGQEAEVDESKPVKSETCALMLPHNTIPCAHTTRIQKPCRHTCRIGVRF